MNNDCDALQTIGKQVKALEIQYGRKVNSVDVLAVSKRHSDQAIRAMHQCGQVCFGENYAQEMVDKAELLADLALEWHYIGPIQSNKTRLIAETATWVHSIDRLKVAQRLNEQRPLGLPDLSVCIQVNISGENTKSGISADDLPRLAEQLVELPRLKLRGLMVIPAINGSFDQQREVFAQTRSLFEQLQSTVMQDQEYFDTLSMGMSGDMEAAIAEGATIVRIGTALFGART